MARIAHWHQSFEIFLTEEEFRRLQFRATDMVSVVVDWRSGQVMVCEGGSKSIMLQTLADHLPYWRIVSRGDACSEEPRFGLTDIELHEGMRAFMLEIPPVEDLAWPVYHVNAAYRREHQATKDFLMRCRAARRLIRAPDRILDLVFPQARNYARREMWCEALELLTPDGLSAPAGAERLAA